jgi:hypothetical protein
MAEVKKNSLSPIGGEGWGEGASGEKPFLPSPGLATRVPLPRKRGRVGVGAFS